ncbi:MAG TPA: HlyD family efflux transporter periplasmic adaptor subunit [Telluria sp.]
MDRASRAALEQSATGHAADAPLFRPQVLSERQAQWLGTILLRPRALQRWFAACALLCVAAIGATLFGASFTRKAHVSGWLVPQQGMLRVFAPRAGVASALLVHEGDEVRQGQSLMVLANEERSATMGDTQARIAQGLAVQRESLSAEQLRTELSFGQQSASLEQRLGAIRTEQQYLEQEIALQNTRLQLAAQSESRQAELQRRGFVAEQQMQAAQEGRLDQAAKLRALQRSQVALGRERLALQAERDGLAVRVKAQTALLARSIAALGREQAESAARRELVITAPQSGIVTAIHVGVGSAVSPGLSLLSIVPRGTRLEAHLYAPSRAIGFVRPRQTVLLRYQAYPYQKFGHYQGVVTSVSRAGIGPSELPPQFGAGAGEELYRITVELARQQVTAYGQAQALQPGMQLDADIALERRRLYEWVLNPLFTLSGKWQP